MAKKLYTVFSEYRGHVQLPSGAYLQPKGSSQGRDRAYPVEVPDGHVLWRLADPNITNPPTVTICEGNVAVRPGTGKVKAKAQPAPEPVKKEDPPPSVPELEESSVPEAIFEPEAEEPEPEAEEVVEEENADDESFEEDSLEGEMSGVMAGLEQGAEEGSDENLSPAQRRKRARRKRK